MALTAFVHFILRFMREDGHVGVRRAQAYALPPTYRSHSENNDFLFNKVQNTPIKKPSNCSAFLWV